MSLVHKVKGDQKPFGQIASTVLLMASRYGNQSSRVDVVFDSYRPISIKTAEIITRGVEMNIHFKSIKADQIDHQWKKFLANMSNKSSFISLNFLVHDWMQHSLRDFITNNFM